MTPHHKLTRGELIALVLIIAAIGFMLGVMA